MTSERNTLIIGSRGSELALWQANRVKSDLESHHPNLNIRIEIIKTIGDKILDSPLSRIGGKGVFTKEIEQALLDQKIDLAVHSLKDLPTELPEGLSIGAITWREDVRDVFIARGGSSLKSIEDIPVGSKVATGSLRRKCQLLHWRRDLEIVDLRGNLNTRFRKLDDSDWAGMVLARAGVIRLGMEARISDVLPVDRMLPAVGQGAIAIEIRQDDDVTRKRLEPLVSHTTTMAVTAERTFLRVLEGGCQVPIGAYARIEQNELLMDGMAGSLDGTKIVKGRTRGKPAEAEVIGRNLALTLLESGADEILGEIRGRKIEEVPPV